MPPAFNSFLPGIIAAITELVVAAMVRSQGPGFSSRFVVFQIIMLVAALLMAVPNRWVRGVAFVLLIAGMLLGAASIDLLYAPAVIAAGWVMARRTMSPTPSFLDIKPQVGIIYTESELEAMIRPHHKFG
jgi:hypothetical protein